MSFSKNASLFLLAFGLASAGCTGTRYHRDFPPRVDRFLADEFSRGASGLADTGSMFYEMTKRDAANTADTLFVGLPNYVGRELWQKPQDMGTELSSLGAREWEHAKALPGAIWDFLELLFGI